MKSLSLFVTIFICLSCSQKGFVGISKKVETNCIGKKSKWAGESFHNLRTKLYNEGKLNFINTNTDTLFILETYEAESGTYVGRIWNRKGAVEYTYVQNRFSFDQQKLFTNYTIDLVQRWDTTAIRIEERINSNKMPGKNINGAKVLLVNTNLQIECIRFKEFFKLDRDR